MSIFRGRALFLVLLLCGWLGPRFFTALDAPPSQAQGAPALGYSLTETWQSEQALLQPGRVGQPADVASTAEGSIFVLDRGHDVIHVFHADRRPRAVFYLPDGLAARRADASHDEQLHILARAEADDTWRVLAMNARGSLGRDVQVTPPDGMDYVDIVALPNARFALVASQAGGIGGGSGGGVGGGNGNGGDEGRASRVDLYDDGGERLQRVDPRELFLPGCEDLIVQRLSTDEQGRIALGIELDASGCPDPEAPMPAPGDPRPPPFTGVLRLSASTLELEEARPSARIDDLDGGPEGLYVVQGGALFEEGGSLPIASISDTLRLGQGAAQDSPPPAGYSLDLGARASILLVSDACPAPGLFSFGTLDKPKAASAFAMLDRPRLGGPHLPLRLAGGQDLVVLEGHRAPADGRFDPLGAPPSALRWTEEGRAVEARRLCAARGPAGLGDANQGDGADLPEDTILEPRTVVGEFARQSQDWLGIAPGRLIFRPDATAPAWTRDDDDSFFLMGDMDADNILVYDGAADRVLRVGHDGALRARWAMTDTRQWRQPTDLALWGRRVLLADQGRSRISVRDIDGDLQGSFGTHDGPKRIATDSEGNVFVLGRNGWGLRYSADGYLEAAWPLPLTAGVEPQDIAVGDDGRVYVSFTRFPPGNESTGLGPPVVGAGIWVFSPLDDFPAIPRTPAGESCVLRGGSRFAPDSIVIGDKTQVELSVLGRCPGWHDPQHLVIVFDNTARLKAKGAMSEAKSLLAGIVGSLDVDNVWVGLVRYDGSARDELPLSNNLSQLRSSILSAAAGEQTDAKAAVRRGIEMLADPPILPDARRTLLLVTDGAMDDPEIETSLQNARASGVDVIALILPSGDWGRSLQDRWSRWIPDAGDRFVAATPARLAPLIARITEWNTEDGLLLDASIEEPLADNMRYVPDSAIPAADYDAQAHVLRWSLTDLPATGTVLRYRVEPQELGTWPKGAPASMDYLDLYGAFDRLAFPIPRVEVKPPPTPAPPAVVYLPFLLRGACKPSARPLDIVLVLDVSGSMAEPAPGGQVKLDAAREAARAFASNLQMPRDRVGLVAFDASAETVLGLSGDEAEVGRALDALRTGSGTRIDLGLEAAHDLVSDQSRSDAAVAVVLLTDGLQSGDPQDVYAAADQLKRSAALVFTIGLGADVDASMLRRVASSPQRFLSSPSAAELRALYDRILLQMDCDASTPLE